MGYVEEYRRFFDSDPVQRTSLRIRVPKPWDGMLYPGGAGDEDARLKVGNKSGGLPTFIGIRINVLGFKWSSEYGYCLIDHPGFDIDIACYKCKYLPQLRNIDKSPRTASFMYRHKEVKMDAYFDQQMAHHLPTLTDRDAWEFCNDYSAWRAEKETLEEFCAWSLQNCGRHWLS
jgi:hypothetical protein